MPIIQMRRLRPGKSINLPKVPWIKAEQDCNPSNSPQGLCALHYYKVLPLIFKCLQIPQHHHDDLRYLILLPHKKEALSKYAHCHCLYECLKLLKRKYEKNMQKREYVLNFCSGILQRVKIVITPHIISPRNNRLKDIPKLKTFCFPHSTNLYKIFTILHSNPRLTLKPL